MPEKLRFIEFYGETQTHKLWTDDQCPSRLEDVIGNQMITETLNTYLEEKNLPNLIFCGPTGCGKSTVAKIIAKKYLGRYQKYCHLTIDGSINRGKNVVSDKNVKKKSTDCIEDPNIINFIRKSLNMPKNMCKIITVYDFDCMTSEAQMALRRVIELYSDRARFIFICNELNEIIEAIQSRTLVLKFQHIGLDDMKSRLKEISKSTNSTVFDDEIYHAIAIIANGDLKQAINCLQNFSGCAQTRNQNESVEKQLQSFYEIFNMPSIATVEDLIKACLKKDEKKAFDILQELFDNGYNESDILDIIIKVLSHSDKLVDRHQRVKFIIATTQCFCINESVPSVNHLYSLIVQFME